MLMKSSLQHTRWSVKQDTAWRGNVEALEQLRVHERKKYHLFQSPDVLLHTSNLVKGHRRIHLDRTKRGIRIQPGDISCLREPSRPKDYPLCCRRRREDG